LGGDLLPHAMVRDEEFPDFARDYLLRELEQLRDGLGENAPDVVLILGNDDAAAEELAFLEGERAGLLHYAQQRELQLRGRRIYGYSYIPPSPFPLKDWEKYDVSRFVDPGCSAPETGMRSVDPKHRPEASTIREDLEQLCGDAEVADALFLFHCPPYDTVLDRAALDGRMHDHAPVDVHIGSIAIRRFLESAQPHISLHGHVHEAARITGGWMEQFGRCTAIGGAHDGPELCVVSFDWDQPRAARRELL
jgi:Icc-related predicted phosphoesterase